MILIAILHQDFHLFLFVFIISKETPTEFAQPQARRSAKGVLVKHPGGV